MIKPKFIAIFTIVLLLNFSLGLPKTFALQEKETIVNYSVNQILKIIEDYENYDKYFFNIDHIEVLSVKKNCTLLYAESRIMGKLFWAKVNACKKVTKNYVKLFIKVKKTNLKTLYGEWVLIPINKNKTKIKLKGKIVPNFSLPEALVNHIINKKMNKILSKLIHHLARLN